MKFIPFPPCIFLMCTCLVPFSTKLVLRMFEFDLSVFEFSVFLFLSSVEREDRQ